MAVGTIDAQALLAQMRALAAQAQGPEIRPAAETSLTNFSAIMRQAIDSVNATQQHAAGLSRRFEQADPNVDLGDVMVSLQKANVSFQAVTQVRNRLVSAYQEIMNMPI
jgi:flagellar hook-basal body complex protein FliE